MKTFENRDPAEPANRLAGKVAIVTGSASGIGRAVARRFAAEGAVVYGADNAVTMLQQEFDSLAQQGYSVHAVPTDVSSAEDTTRLVQRVVEEQDRIDVLANIAGVLRFITIEETTLELWDWILNVNLRGTFLMCREVVPIMKRARRGSIINVSSRAGVVGSAREVAYCASKFGVEGLSRALAKEVEFFGIAVNSITPGVPVLTGQSDLENEPDKFRYDPAVVAPAFVHLAVQSSQGIHNQYVDAGELADILRLAPGPGSTVADREQGAD